MTKIDETQDHSLVKPRDPKPKKLPFSVPKYNWVPDKKDKRDYLYKAVPIKTPNSVDLRPYCSLVEDQGNLGSCTGNAIAGAIEYLARKNNNSVDVSRLYIYYYERLLEGTVNYDSGAYIRDGIKACYYYGASSETLWPYDISKFKMKPSASAIADGAKRKVTLYERATDFNACINAIANGYPVTIGFTVYSSFQSPVVYRTGMMPYPNVRRESILGGHAVLLVGYNNNTQRFIARNSWGTYWGDKGYFYMPYDVIKNTNMSGDFWVIKNVTSI